MPLLSFYRLARLVIAGLFLFSFCLYSQSGFATGERGTKEEAQALVARALAELDKVGPDIAYKEFTDKSGPFVDRDLYLIVFNRSGEILAHGANSALVNKNLWDVTDPDGVYFVREFWKKITESPEGGWVYFKFTHPITKKIEKKIMWVRHDDKQDVIVIAGAYPGN